MLFRSVVIMLEAIKPIKKARVGLYSVGLKAYWDQFPGLRDRMVEYGAFIGKKLSGIAEVYNFGLVDEESKGREAGEWFNAQNVDIIFCHTATYVTSSVVLPVHQQCKAPVVILNLQPAARINYKESTTGEWLAHCGACVTPEISNALNRGGVKFRVVNGLLGLDYTPSISLANEVTSGRKEAERAWAQIIEYVNLI